MGLIANLRGPAGSSELSYDTTGATDAAPALQAAIDAGSRHITIPPGRFYANSSVFDDWQDGNATLKIEAHGVTFNAGIGLAQSAEWNAWAASVGRLSGTKWFLFPSTLRPALSGGVVTGSGNYVNGTNTYPVARVPVSPRLSVEGGTWNASNIAKYNAGFVFGNRGGSTILQNLHMSSARTLLSWTDYVDANKMLNCSGWGSAVMDSSYDSSLWYGIGSGDGVFILGCKTDNYIFCSTHNSCNGATIQGTVGGGHRFVRSHGIVIISNHTEAAAGIGTAPRIIYDITDSDVTIIGSFDYMSDDIANSGAVYLNDSGGEGLGSRVDIIDWSARNWLTTSDPGLGPAIYINKMGNPSIIRCRGCSQTQSVSGSFYSTHSRMGLKIDGNATKEPSLAAAVNAGRDTIASGDFEIAKYQLGAVSAGQDQPITVTVRPIGPLSSLYISRLHTTPTFYDTEVSGYGTGTLTSGQIYSYCAAVCNTLPDGTIQYGQATGGTNITPGAARVAGTELYTPTAAYGATLVVWRKTGNGVLTTPDRYVLIPIQSATVRLLDTGANINKLPWLTTSIPVPSTVAAANHTADGLYVNGTQVTIP